MRLRFIGVMAVVLLFIGVLAASAGDPIKKSDVVGNNGFAGLSGHVGLYDGKGKILEVYLGTDSYSINSTCVHYGRTLATFKKGGFWGTRYDKNLSSSKLLNVYDVFKKQGDSYKATYNLLLPLLKLRTSTTYAWVMKIGKKPVLYTLEQKQVTGNAILRCDFTVASAYREKAGKDLANTSSFLPSTVYNKMPNAR